MNAPRMRMGKPARLRLSDDVRTDRAQESELLFRATFDQAAVGIARVDSKGRITLANRRLHDILGYEPGELLGRTYKELSHPDDANVTDGIRADLHDGKVKTFSVEKRYLRKDGSAVWISLTVSLLRGVDASQQYEISVFQDITLSKRSELLLRLEHSVARCLAEADDASSAMRSVIRAMCETEGWECGRFLRVDERAGAMRLDEAWGVPSAAIERFLASSRAVSYAPGVGVAGTVWKTGQPLWIPDIEKDPRAVQRTVIREIGLRGAIMFPVIAQGKTVGVLAFNSREIREPDERLLQAVRVIGSQIGQLLQRMNMEETLRESETHYRALSELSADWYWEQDARFRFTEISGHLGEQKQFRREVWLGKTRWELPYVDVSEDAWRAHKAALEAHRPFRDFVVASPRKGGGLQYISTSGYPVFDSAGNFGGYRGIARDVSERKRAEQLQKLEHTVTLALAGADSASSALKAVIRAICESEGWECGRYLRVDEAAGVLRFSESWSRPDPILEQFIAEKREAVLGPDVGLAGKVWQSGQPLWSADTVHDPRALGSPGMRGAFLFPVTAEGKTIGVLSFNSRKVRDPNELLLPAVAAIGSQIGQFVQRKHAEERLAYMAQFDALTGLPNRHLFQDRLVHTMAQAKRSGHPMAVLFIDLDRFKLVNDTQGHRAGDKLLKEAAARLAQCVRSSDTVGRFGGDEFGAILSDLGRPGDASRVAEKIIGALAQPFVLDGHETFISASIGITLFPTDGEEAATLIMNADVAMYRAKEQGRSNYQYFTREMNERALERVRMDAALRRAIERREFMLHYQPRVDLKTGAICGFEALLRWQHPDRGLVSPAEFIPVLEDTGLIVPVGEWVMQEACTQVQAWRAAGLAVPPVAVNLSARQFQQKDLEATVRRILQATGVSASLLELELTESMLMKDPETAALTLHGLKEAGVKLSVDDFGTGYSSLSYLKRFPIDSLKIDRAFIRDVTVDPDDAAITLAIIGLGHSLKLKVIAEGVETEAQLDFLSAWDCDEMQGFYFARPLPVADCTQALIEDRRLKTAGRAA